MPRHHSTARTKARRRALDVLFEADAKGAMTPDGLRALLAERLTATVAQDGLAPYSLEIVEGVARHLTLIDEAIEVSAHGWTLARMPYVDRNLLRLGVWEVVFNDGVEDGAAIEQASAIAAELSTDDSPTFVGGVLNEIARTKETYRF